MVVGAVVIVNKLLQSSTGAAIIKSCYSRQRLLKSVQVEERFDFISRRAFDFISKRALILFQGELLILFRKALLILFRRRRFDLISTRVFDFISRNVFDLCARLYKRKRRAGSSQGGF